METSDDHQDNCSRDLTALKEENRALRVELQRLQNSLRMRAASLVAEALSSPRSAITLPKRLWLFFQDAQAVKQWRKLVLGLECGLPNDPLRTMSSETISPAIVSALATTVLDGKRPETISARQSSSALEVALDRCAELDKIANKNVPWSAARTDRIEPCAPKKVSMILHACEQDVINGYTRRSHELMRALLATGWDVVGAVRGEGNAYVGQDNCRYSRIGSVQNQQGTYAGYINQYAERIYLHLTAARPALVHAASNHVTGLAASIAAKRAGLPFIYEVRGLWEETRISVEPAYHGSLGYLAQQQLEIEVAKRADHLLVNGRPLAAHFSKYGIEESKITIVPNGCSRQAELEPETLRALKHRWELSDEPIIGYVGSLTKYEGLDDVLAALSKMRDLPFQLLIVGDGPSRPSLEEGVRKLKLSDRTRWTGRITPEEANQAYALIDIAPLVRTDTPVNRLVPPLKPLDAMKSGAATILSDLPPLRYFGENERALIVPSGDVSAIVAALRALLTDVSAREEMTRRAKYWALSSHHWSSIAKVVDGVYKKFL